MRKASVHVVKVALLLMFVAVESKAQVSSGSAADAGRGSVVLRSDVRQPPPMPEREKRMVRALLKTARIMLRNQKVPFDPDLVVEDEWRAKIDPALFTMPEMQTMRRVTEPMRGVYIANVLLVPEQLTLTGDTVILVRELAPDDENRELMISGDGELFVFIIGDGKKFDFRNGPRGRITLKTTAPCSFVGMSQGYLLNMRCQGSSFFRG